MQLGRRALLATPFIAPIAARAQQADWVKVIETANSQGHLNLLHNVPPPLGDTWIGEFRKVFPKISVEGTRLGSSELMQRFGTEYSAGASQSDVVLTLWDETLLQYAKDGWVKRWTPPEAAVFKSEYRIQDQFFITNFIRGGVVSSKTRIKEADAPKEWKDFFDPRWKDRIGMDPPWRSVAVQTMLAMWDKLGIKDVAKRLKENGVRFFNGSAGVTQAVIRGDIWVAAVIEPPVISAIADGAPIRINFPASGVPTTGSPMFVPAKSPNPEAGMVFLNWVLSESGMQIFQDILGSPVARPGIKPPKLVPGIDGQKIELSSDLLTPANQKAIIDEWRSVFGLQ